MVVGISIFDEDTGVRVERGNTFGSGEYCGMTILDPSKSYRVEYYELPSDTCVGWVQHVTVEGDPQWVTDHCPCTATTCLGGHHFGGACSGWDEVTDCWGP